MAKQQAKRLRKRRVNGPDAFDSPDMPHAKKNEQRQLDLLFFFSTCSRPTTSQIMASEIYPAEENGRHVKLDSRMRKFRRDREQLAELGIYIVEDKNEGTSETEESPWKIDEERSFVTLVKEENATQLLHIIEAELMRPITPLRVPLSSIKTKVLECYGAMGAAADECSEREKNLWAAYGLKRQLVFTYTNAKNEQKRRTVSIYGLFEDRGELYFVGLDSANNEIRTFKLSRVKNFNKLGSTYAIPDDFSLDDYRFFSFDIANEHMYTVKFLLPSDLTEREINKITHKRGQIENQGGSLIWTTEASNLRLAARYALVHSREGMKPLAPAELVETWKEQINKAVALHG